MNKSTFDENAVYPKSIIWPLLFVAIWLYVGWTLREHAPPVGVEALTNLTDSNSGDILTLPLKLNRDTSQRLRHYFVSQKPYLTPQALYIGLTTQAISITLNGVALEPVPLRAESELAGLRQSYLFLIPPQQLNVGGNALEWVITPNAGSRKPLQVADVYLGERDVLDGYFRANHARIVVLPQLVAIIALLIGTISLMLWYYRRQETLFAWFGLGVCLWMIYLSHYLWHRLPLNGSEWIAFIHVALLASLICIQQFVYQFFSYTRPRADRILIAFAGAASAAMLIISLLWPDDHLTFFIAHHYVFRAVLVFFGLRLLYLLARIAISTRSAAAIWLTASVFVGVLFGVSDSLIVLQRESQKELIFHIGILPMVLVFGFTLLSRFVQLLNLAETQAAQLDAKAQESSVKLEREYLARQLFERERLLVDERHRLATDLHDGAGSLLVSLLAAVRKSGLTQAQMEQALVEAISDLRLVMDSIDSTGSDLAEALGQFRSRMEPRLTAAGLKSIWRTASLREDLKLSPRRTLNVFRALQEAIVNCIKHAEASEVKISARDLGSTLELIVEDNGRGLAGKVDTTITGGRGLKNLEQRMKNLGGYCKFESLSGAQHGLSVQLFIPIPNENETKW